MTIFACFGPMISLQDLMIILSVVMGIGFTLIGGIAFVISKVLGIRMLKVLGVGTIILLVCGVVIIPLGLDVAAVLILSGAIVCGCVLAIGGLINLISERWGTPVEEDLCFLKLDAR